ncbi:MAG: uracil-DNA glycosylase [Thiotrichales bacterium]
MLSKQQKYYLNAIGITRWQRRELDMPTPEVVPATSLDIGSQDWPELAATVAGCQRCELSQTRTQTVFGAGDQHADWMIIGEAPGEQEDLQGVPFVGRAGVLLNNMLRAIGLERERVYIANVIKCRPPGNRDPHADEINACLLYLHRQVELLQPRMILVVGRVAAQTLLETSDPVGRLRDEVHHYPGSQIPLVVTYHPAYLLRRPSEKSKSWADLKLALSHYEPGEK